ncbi:hypothetical protein C8J56DRAFT_890737 [Mycena floridula]|nr:hypothetical protein C8J56DRAFT_890737 [Mycena floridula]
MVLLHLYQPLRLSVLGQICCFSASKNAIGIFRVKRRRHSGEKTCSCSNPLLAFLFLSSTSLCFVKGLHDPIALGISAIDKCAEFSSIRRYMQTHLVDAYRDGLASLRHHRGLSTVIAFSSVLDIVAASLSESGYKLVDQRQFQCRRLFAMDALPISSMLLSSSSEALDVASPLQYLAIHGYSNIVLFFSSVGA